MAKEKVSKAQAVRLDENTVNKLKKMYVEMWWVEFKTYDDKINHLMWHFDNYRKEKQE